MPKQIRKGAIVRYREVIDKGDDIARFRVKEKDRNRCLIEFIGTQVGRKFEPARLAVLPTYRVDVTEIKAV